MRDLFVCLSVCHRSASKYDYDISYVVETPQNNGKSQNVDVYYQLLTSRYTLFMSRACYCREARTKKTQIMLKIVNETYNGCHYLFPYAR